MIDFNVYQIPANTVRCEIEVKRSRFIATLVPVGDRRAAELALQMLRTEFSDATHNCYAFIAGMPGGTGDVACSDDGEVEGTAGRPLLNLLQHSDLGEVLLVVTRYYGGTLLGTGGLVRAYSDAGKAALDMVTRQTRQHVVQYILMFDFACEADVRRLLVQAGADVIGVEYQQQVFMCIALAESRWSSALAELNNITRGKISAKLISP